MTGTDLFQSLGILRSIRSSRLSRAPREVSLDLKLLEILSSEQAQIPRSKRPITRQHEGRHILAPVSHLTSSRHVLTLISGNMFSENLRLYNIPGIERLADPWVLQEKEAILDCFAIAPASATQRTPRQSRPNSAEDGSSRLHDLAASKAIS